MKYLVDTSGDTFGITKMSDSACATETSEGAGEPEPADGEADGGG
jgi:hypothetical protein